MYNLTFNNNQIYKIFDSIENKSTGLLTIQFQPSDYSLENIITVFDTFSKDDLRRIIKTTSTGNHVTTFDNYTDVIGKSIEKAEIQVEVTEEVPTLDESGQEILVTVPSTEIQQVDLIVVTLKYEDPTKIMIEKINQQINPSIDIENCTIEELKEWQKYVINTKCTIEIENGIDVLLSDGNTYHFSYKLVDQINYAEMYQKIEYDGYTKLPYHPDNGDCTIYDSADIKTIITRQRINKFYLTTKCNAYHRMIDEATTKENVMLITWGSKLSPERQQAFDDIISGITL